VYQNVAFPGRKFQIFQGGETALAPCDTLPPRCRLAPPPFYEIIDTPLLVGHILGLRNAMHIGFGYCAPTWETCLRLWPEDVLSSNRACKLFDIRIYATLCFNYFRWHRRMFSCGSVFELL